MVNPETKNTELKRRVTQTPPKQLEVTPDAHRGKVIPVSY